MKRLMVIVLVIVLFSGVARAWDEREYFAEREQVSISQQVIMDMKNIPTEVKELNPTYVQSMVVVYGGLGSIQHMVRGQKIPRKWKRHLWLYWLAKRGGGIG